MSGIRDEFRWEINAQETVLFLPNQQFLLNSHLPRHILQYLVRIQFPLCYNYLLLLRYPGSENCAIMHVMSHMETVPFFGTLTFNSYAPLLIVLLCFATKFNIYGKVLAWLSIEHEDAVFNMGGEEFVEKEREGKILLSRGSSGRSNNNNSNNNNDRGGNTTSAEFSRISTSEQFDI